MQRVYEGQKELGSQLLSEKSRRNAGVNITDVEFVDDLVIVAGEVRGTKDQAQEVLSHLEQEAERVGLYCNAKGTELQIFNHHTSNKATWCFFQVQT